MSQRLGIYELASMVIVSTAILSILYGDIAYSISMIPHGIVRVDSLAVIATVAGFLGYLGLTAARSSGVDLSDLYAASNKIKMIFGKKHEGQAQLRKQQPSQQQDQPKAQEIKLHEVEIVPQPQKEQRDDNVRKDIGELKEMVAKLSSELNEIKRNTEQSLMDVRTILSEISNPLNYMRKFAEESEMRELGISLTTKAGEQPQTQKAEPQKEIQTQTQQPGQAAPAVQPAQKAVEEALHAAGIRNLYGIMKAIIDIGGLVNEFGVDQAREIIALMVASGAASKEMLEYVDQTIRVLKAAGGAQPAEVAARLYKVARTLGIYDPNAEKLYYKILEELYSRK